MNRNFLALLPALALAGASLAHAQTGALFSDDFDSDTSAQWQVFEGSGSGVPDFTAEFAFDYSTLGIPPAPNSTGGTTRGVRFTVNNNDETPDTSGVSAYPASQSFSGDYALRVDMWLGYNGPAFGGTGSTEYGTFGINHAGGKVSWADANLANSDGVWFAVTGEGGTGTAGDYQAYEGLLGGPPFRLGAFDAGFLDRDGDSTPENEVNPAQPLTFPLKAILPAPPGETPGAPGKQWVEVEVRQRDGELTWLINGFVIASRANISGFDAGNVMIGTMDTFASIASPREQNFALFDNLRVVSLADVPSLPVVEITSDDAEATESGGDTARFTVRRSGDTSAPLTVNLRMSGSATPGADYEALPDTVTLPAGQEAVTVDVVPLDDALGEADEDIVIALRGSPDYEVRERVVVALILKDDGDVPVATVRAVRPVAYESNPRAFGQFAVELNTPGLTDLTVTWTFGGTAVNGTHFEALPVSATFPAGETSALLNVVPRDDSDVNPDRMVELTLAEGSGYVLDEDRLATVRVRNDDLPAGPQLFAEDFDTDPTANWTVNQGPGDGVAEFHFDYATVGVPPAPHSGGTTRGLKLQANLTAGVFSGVSVSPNGQSFAGDYRLRFDLWQNFNGPLPDGGSGSTQITGAGIGTAGTSPQWPAGTQDSLWFATSADGGSSIDYRAYSPLAPTGYTMDSGVFAGGSRDQGDPYYAEFGREPAPEAQVAQYANQTGQTYPGAQGFQWRDVVITKQGNQVTWVVDGLRLATVDVTAITFGGGNILFLHSDINAGSSSDPNAPDLAFGLVDNVRVEQIESVPPTTLTSIELDGGMVRVRFTGSGQPADFALESAAAITGPFAAEPTAVIQSVAAGEFEATVALTGDIRFYRVRR
jgi:hypothetical protein